MQFSSQANFEEIFSKSFNANGLETRQYGIKFRHSSFGGIIFGSEIMISFD